MITVNLNNKQYQVAHDTSVEGLLLLHKIPNSGIAVAINNTVIPKVIWNSKILEHSDTITVIQATQGG